MSDEPYHIINRKIFDITYVEKQKVRDMKKKSSPRWMGMIVSMSWIVICNENL
jgi:hypothetical protein